MKTVQLRELVILNLRLTFKETPRPPGKRSGTERGDQPETGGGDRAAAGQGERCGPVQPTTRERAETEQGARGG